MEENEKLNTPETPQEESPEASDAACDEAALQTTAAAREESETEQQAPKALQEERDERTASREAVSLEFGTGVPQKKWKPAVFFAVFGGVFLLCVALLAATFFLGDDAIHIVKTLYNERVVYVREDDGTSGLLTPNEAADLVKKSTVTISVKTALGTGIGSGFVYDDKGHICTNHHVVADAVSVQVILPDGQAHNATVVGVDEIADIAVLKIEATGLVPARLGSSAELLVGDAVVAVGTPASPEFAGTATFGNVSATRRLLPLTDASGSVYRKIWVIQTDTSVNPGNSGGPMADMYGRVVGIVVRKMLSYNGTAYEGVGFAIPIDGAKIIVDAIIQNGSFTGRNPVAEGRSLLGITGHTGEKGLFYAVNAETGTVAVSEQALEGYHEMPVSGVYVMELNGSNARGKLQVGDVITAINGLEMATIQDVVACVNRYPAYSTVNVTVWRDGAPLGVEIMLLEVEAS